MNSQVQYRNMWAQVFLMIITLGIYGIYWFYVTAVEMKTVANDQRAEPGLWTILIFVPFGALYSHYKYAELHEKISHDQMNRWILWILWIIFSPAVWFIVQTELNNIATGGSEPQQVAQQ